MNNIIAIVGMCGSGKSVLCEEFEKKGYKKVYFGGVTIDYLKENNMEINPENEKKVREDLRKELGMGAYAIKLLPKIEEYSNSSNVILDGLYSWEEYLILKEKFKDRLKVIAVVTDKDIRYDRLSKRDIRPLTNIEAENRDLSEINNVHKAPPIAYADYFILNNSDIDTYIKNINELYIKLSNI